MDETTKKTDLAVGFPVPGWKGSSMPPRTGMEGQYCRLEVLDPDRHALELDEAYAADTEDRVWVYLSDGPFDDFASFRAWLEASAKGDDPLFYAIIDGSTQRAVGVASYLRIKPEAGSIEVGNLNFSPALQRSPAATEAMFLMLARAFDELNYRRYEWKCDALNARSRRAAERLGFSFEGIFRQALIYKGRNRDTAWYSLLDHEWPATRAAYRAWLSPENFDESGAQRRRLGELIQEHRAA